MLKMEDSGIDSDCKSNSNGGGPNAAADAENSTATLISKIEESPHCSVKFSTDNNSYLKHQHSNTSEDSSVQSESPQSPTAKLMTTSQLQKRLEKQILQAKKIRQKEQNLMNDSVPKKLIPRSRLKVPKSSQVPVVTKADSFPLVSWESESDDEEFNLLPLSKKSTREVTQQLLKDGYNLDLTPDDEDLDLIPPKPLEQRCTCCNPNHICCIL